MEYLILKYRLKTRTRIQYFVDKNIVLAKVSGIAALQFTIVNEPKDTNKF